MATELGVIVLPGVFFGHPLDERGEVREGGELDRYIRFSVGNVGDEDIKVVCERLREHLGGMRKEDLD